MEFWRISVKGGSSGVGCSINKSFFSGEIGFWMIRWLESGRVEETRCEIKVGSRLRNVSSVGYTS